MPTLHFKQGVDPTNWQSEILLALMVAKDVYFEHGFDCVVTRGKDYAAGQVKNSLHNRDGICRAIDLRSNHLPNEMVAHICTGVALRLPDGFDVVQEKDHLHIEWDPKPKKVA